MIVAIGGVSRAGKTLLAKKISLLLNRKTSIIHLDDFIRSDPFDNKINNQPDWEHPSSIDFDKLYKTIVSRQEDVEILIIEGFLITYDRRIRSLINFYLHVEITQETALKRRMDDYGDARWYAEHVWESYKRLGENYYDLHHIVVDGEMLTDYISILNFLNSE